MSSDDLENKGGLERLLFALKSRGPLTSGEAGAVLGTTKENARQHLTRAAEAGLVEARSEAKGVGRPAQRWSLTDAGHGRFPNTHADVAVDLLVDVRLLFGREALDRLIDAREARTRSAYRSALASLKSVGERVARLAELRTREGYMAHWTQEEDGSFLLVENHCPICAAARICQGFCRAEWAVFQDALGPQVKVERTEHVLSGGRRCTYRITPVAKG